MSDITTIQDRVEESQALIDEAIKETSTRPEEPSLPLDEWMNENLFAKLSGVVATMIFGALGLAAYRSVLNFIFGNIDNAVPAVGDGRWDSVRVNLRLLFTQAYPDENYTRVWVSVGIVAVLAGLSLGLTKVGQGLSLKKLLTWCITAGLLLVVGLLIREPTEMGTVYRVWIVGIAIAALAVGLRSNRSIDYFAGTVAAALAMLFWRPIFALIGSILSAIFSNSDRELVPIETEVELVAQQSFFDAAGERTTWWVVGLLLLGAGLAAWIALGDQRRRFTFVPAIPVGIAGIGLLISTTWWYPWGNYTFGEEGFVYEPDEFVASTTRNPWTVIFFLLLGAYFIGRTLQGSSRAGIARAAVNGSWLLAPFVTFWAVLRGPVLDWGYIASVDLPLWLLFATGGAVLLWVMTQPGIGETGRLIAVAILAAAAFTWIGAFFGWFSMLQKIRLSLALLGLAGLLAPNFIGETKQRLKLVYGWLGFITVFHIMVTLINTPSSIEVPTEDFAGGFMVSIYVSIFTIIFSFPLGVLLALARTSRLPLFRVMATIYIEAFRGVPLITMLFFFTVFINLFLPEGMELSLFAAVTIAFTLFSAAYLAENVRGGLQAIRRGQYEASDALGLTTVQRTSFIVLPQALRVSIPPLVGQIIATFKETSLLAIVGVFDFLRMARDVIPAQTEFLGIRRPGLLFISAVYFIGAYAMSKYSQRLEKQLGVGER